MIVIASMLSLAVSPVDQVFQKHGEADRESDPGQDSDS
jgi:hypothetical protein